MLGLNMTSVSLNVVLAVSKEFCKAASLQGEKLHGTMMVARQPSPSLGKTWTLSGTCRPSAPSYWQLCPHDPLLPHGLCLLKVIPSCCLSPGPPCCCCSGPAGTSTPQPPATWPPSCFPNSHSLWTKPTSPGPSRTRSSPYWTAICSPTLHSCPRYSTFF